MIKNPGNKSFKFIIHHSSFIVHKSAGFTLIEISIVVSILAMLTTVGIASFVNYSRSQALQSAAYDLKTSLNLAKSRSFSQVKPTSCGNQTLDGYKVAIYTTSNSYELTALCAGNVYVVKSTAFPSNIVISADSTSTSFFFPVISGGVVGSGSAILTGFGQTRTITVDSIGTVK